MWSIFSTCSYLLERLWNRGYATRLECGIPSFSAAAARLGIPLVSGAEELHVIPATYQVKDALKLPGVKVLMKTGKQMKTVKEEIRKCGASAVMVENWRMADERVFASLEEIPDEPGYYFAVVCEVRDGTYRRSGAGSTGPHYRPGKGTDFPGGIQLFTPVRW